MVLLFASCGHLSFLLFCFEFLSFFFSFLSKKRPPQKPDTTKTQKSKNAEKIGQKKNQLAQLCSQIVFLNFWGGLKDFSFWLKTL